MKVTPKAIVIFDKSIDTFKPEARDFIKNEAKKALEENFSPNVKFYIYRERLWDKYRGPHYVGPEILIEAHKKGFVSSLKHAFNMGKPVATHFEQFDELRMKQTLSESLKYLANSAARIKYSLQEILHTARKAIKNIPEQDLCK